MSMSSMSSSTSSSDRLLTKLEALLASDHYYEAHQIYRTLYHRMSRSNRSEHLSRLLYEGSLHLLRKSQFNSGADLACLYLDVMSNSCANQSGNQSNNRQLVTNIRNLFELIPPKTPERLAFINKAVKLSVASTPAIHRQFAVVLWREKNFAESRNHFAHSSSESGDDCALMLVEYQTASGFTSEVDLFIAQFVLQVLCIKNKSMADNTFHAYTSKHPSIGTTSPPFLLPLLNFLWFLLLAIDSGKTSTFKVLCELYGTTLKRDPSYTDYLTQIGQIYFGVENASRGRGAGFFGNLLQSLLEGGESEEEAPNAGPSRRREETSQEVELD